MQLVSIGADAWFVRKKSLICTSKSSILLTHQVYNFLKFDGGSVYGFGKKWSVEHCKVDFSHSFEVRQY